MNNREDFKSYISANKTIPELTIKAILVGILLASVGLAIGAIGAVIVIFLTIVAMLICGVLSAIGGAIGEYVQSAGHRDYYEYEDY